MLSDDERYVQRPGPGAPRDGGGMGMGHTGPGSYGSGSLGARRTSVRPQAPPPLSYAPPISHPFALRSQPDVRAAESSSQSGSHSHYTSRNSGVPGDGAGSYVRPSAPARRPMNPPSLNLPPEPAQTLASSSSGSSTVGGRPSPSPSPAPGPMSPVSPPRQSGSRPSSRRALVAALSLAQEAVKLDTAGTSPQAAVDAYARSVVLLREVMSRVSSGESASAGPSASSSSSTSSASRSLTPREEEVRRLKSIHDTYAERLEVLCNMYNIVLPDVPTPVPTSTSSRPAGPSRNPSQEVIAAAFQAGSRTSSRSPRPADADSTAANSLLALTSPDRETPSANPFAPDPAPTSTLAASRVTSLPPQRPPPTGPPPPKPITPLTARPINNMQGQQQQLLEQPRESTHRRVPSNGSDRGVSSAAEDSDRTEVVPRPPSALLRRKASATTLATEDRPAFLASPLPPPPPLAPPTNSEPASPTPVPSPSTPRGGSEQQQAKRGVSTSSQISTSTTYDSGASSAAGLRSRGNTASSASSWSDADGAAPEKQQLVRPVAASGQGTIAMRRKVTTSASSQTGPPPLPTSASPAASSSLQQQPGGLPPIPGPSHSAGTLSNRLTADSLPPSTLSSLGIAPGPGRNRAVSQPGRRPSNATDRDRDAPPLPMTANGSLMIPRKASIPHSLANPNPSSSSNSSSFSSTTTTIASASVPVPGPGSRLAAPVQGINITVHTAGGTTRLQTPGVNSGLGLGGSYFQSQQAAGAPLVAPSSPPVDPLRRPFHLMSLVLASMTSKHGGFITRRLFVPHDVWVPSSHSHSPHANNGSSSSTSYSSFGPGLGVKLPNLTEKGKCVEVLNAGLEDVSLASGEFFRGAGRGNAEKWLKSLDDWSAVCDGVLAGPGKKLGVGEGFAGRKTSGVTSWGGKFSKAMDRMTTTKGSDLPSVYIAGLTRLLQQAQLFDEHVKAFSNSFTPTPYSTLPPDIRHQIEMRLKRSAEFFASVVLTWVIRDLGMLLDKYVKRGEKWLTE